MTRPCQLSRLGPMPRGVLGALVVAAWLTAAGLTAAGGLVAAAGAAEKDEAGEQFFERKVRPVLVKYCYECHAADSEEIGGGLRLDTREATLKGGESGPSIVPGDPRGSLLIAAVEYRDLEMPPDMKLPEDVINDLRRWVRMGAPDPRKGQAPEPVAEKSSPDEPPLWSLQPVRKPDVPDVARTDWPRGEVDRFILARLEQADLQPVGDAAPETLLRRAYFDLVGLPPEPGEVDAFVADPSAERFAEVVDRLLQSPQFGERWGRHWLDVVRYAESAGNSRDVLMPYAYRYRDYVIDALNRDLPYDRFLVEQLAGDLLPAESAEERDRLQVATGLLAVGSKSLNGGNVELDLVDDQIDVVGKAILGLTISCARCHDHKFDPIPTADYYALAGIFRSTETYYGGGTNRPKTAADQLKVYLPLGEDASQRAEQAVEREKTIAQLTKQQAAAAKQVKNLEGKLPKDWKQQLAAEQEDGEEPNDAEAKDAKQRAPLRDQVARLEAARGKLAQFQEQLKKLQAEKAPELEFAVGVRDKDKVADHPIQIRGERTRAGDVVPRGFLSCVSLESLPSKVENTDRSGRLELAGWLTHPDHPLTARVLVNRVWQHLYGQGLVESVDNFGVNGLPPSHPLLLDYLANRFVHEHQWSIKSLIRELVLTRTYQLAGEYSAAAYEVDPGNQLCWRMSRRRLEAEALRDAMLACGGNLRLEPPAASQVTKIGEGEVGRGINTRPLEEPFPHRSVYLPIIRGLVPEMLKLFDLPEPSNPQGQRAATNVPAQSLFLMNSPFVIEQAEGLARRVRAAEAEDSARLELAYRICLSRSPSSAELERGREFLARTARRLAESPEKEKDPEKDRSAAVKSDQLAWTMLCQSLMASAEFRYLE